MASKARDVADLGNSVGVDDNATSTAITIDASENVGIGATTVDSQLHIEKSQVTAYNGSATDGQLSVGATAFIQQTGGSNNALSQIVFQPRSGYGYNRIVSSGGSAPYMALTTNNAERLRIAASGNVGIGTSSPSYTLDVNGGTNNIVASFTSTDTNSVISFGDNTTAPQSMYLGAAGNDMFFNTNGAERMRIDSSGNVLVGKSVEDFHTQGVALRGSPSSGESGSIFTRDGGKAAAFNRLTSDGSIVSFNKDGSVVGSIGATSNNVFLNASGGNYGILQVNGNNRYVWSETAFYPENDNARDLGISSKRWDDIYATNGTIQTSDRNEKQDIAALTTAEITAAKAISAGFKTFKWNDSVAEKGAEARTHSGVIAQEVEQALTDAGLDAGDYAFFISNTWWETHTEVPAVEAVAEVLDAEGVVITEAVEAKEAYTRTDTYHTLAEAPEGATERTRKGIRYPQLLAFVGAATEQRLASIEARLTALEVTP